MKSGTRYFESNMCLVDEREDAKKRNKFDQVGTAKWDLGSGVCSSDPMSCAQLLPSPRISL